jgi:hypothetical protein
MGGRPVENVGRSYLGLVIFRALRALAYGSVGAFRPGWRRALPLLRVRDRYADKGTMAVAIYSDPRFDQNLRALDAEIREVRAGRQPSSFRLPFDFPPGSQDLVDRLTNL